MASRSPHGSPLEAPTLADLRRALLEHGGARRLAPMLGTSAGSLERAAAGEHILRGTESLILVGLQKLQAVAAAPSTRGRV